MVNRAEHEHTLPFNTLEICFQFDLNEYAMIFVVAAIMTVVIELPFLNLKKLIFDGKPRKIGNFKQVNVSEKNE